MAIYLHACCCFLIFCLPFCNSWNPALFDTRQHPPPSILSNIHTPTHHPSTTTTFHILSTTKILYWPPLTCILRSRKRLQQHCYIKTRLSSPARTPEDHQWPLVIYRATRNLKTGHRRLLRVYSLYQQQRILAPTCVYLSSRGNFPVYAPY